MNMSNSDHCVQNKLGSVIKRNHTAIYHKAFDIWSEVLVFIATHMMMFLHRFFQPKNHQSVKFTILWKRGKKGRLTCVDW